MSTEWHYARDGNRFAPVSEESLRSLIEAGDLLKTDLVWHAGMSKWETAQDQFSELFPPARKNSLLRYLVSHWRGELSLARSLFVNGLLLGMLLIGACYFLASKFVSLSADYGLALYWLTLYIFLGASLVWLTTGIWRSSVRHPVSDGFDGLKNVARLAVAIVWLVFVTALLSSGLPGLRSSIEQARWLQTEGRWEIQVIRDGREVELSGGIGHGIADEVAATFRRWPGIEVVHLNLKNGGLVSEAEAMYRLFDERGVVTYVSTSCQSACTLAFLGGRERYLRNGATLGFHHSAIPGFAFQFLDVSSEKAIYSARGIRDDFVSHVYDTPPDSMWTPDEKTLLEAGVVTAFVSGNQFGLSGFRRDAMIQKTAAVMEQMPLYRLLRDREPAMYEKISAIILDAISSGQAISDTRDKLAPMLQGLRVKYLPMASDEAARDLLLHFAALTRRLKSNPAVCVGYLRDNDAKVMHELSTYYTPELREQELAVLARLIESAAPGRHAPKAAVTDRMIGTLLELAATRLGGQRGDLLALADAHSDPTAWCNAASALWEVAAELPPAEAHVAALVLALP